MKNWPMKTLHVFLIDPTEQLIQAARLPSTDEAMWDAVYNYMGHRSVTMAGTPDGGHAFLCDDMALLRDNPDQLGYFQPAFRDYPLCNKAVLIGIDPTNGNFQHCTLTLEWLQEHISFPRVHYAGHEMSQGLVEHPVFGEMWQIRNVPKFVPIEPKDLN